MVSLIDRDTQYFVAESTKTLSLEDSSVSEHPNDAIWAGCINVPKAGRLCEHTLQAMPSQGCRTAHFEVLDMPKDERFQDLPFVQSEPFFKYYCGVPLRTKNGVNIGSLFALDDKVREPLSSTNLSFLSIMADNVMTHLEASKEKEQRRQALNMNVCLAAFVDRKYQKGGQKKRTKRADTSGKSEALLLHSQASPIHRDTSRASQSGSEYLRGSPEASDSCNKAIEPSPLARDHCQEHDPVRDSSASDASDKSRMREPGDSVHRRTFERAADLLRKALSLEYGGGVVFLDTATASVLKETCHSSSVLECLDDEEATISRQGPTYGTPNEPSVSPEILGSIAAESTQHRNMQAAALLGESITEGLDTHGNKSNMSPADLERLVKRHPRGRLYAIHEDVRGASGSSSEDSRSATRDVRRGAEAKLLLRYFPAAKQVIFIPLWDPNYARWSACFAYTTSEYRTFSHEADFLFCVAFCNCIMAETSRLATVTADQQKGDFIGSVSHELRSPLHGIMASCEFLQDTECSAFQRSLIDTAESCARTLLDTINMVLDYSKINSFERDWRSAGKGKRGRHVTALEGPQAFLNIYDEVDVAAITEEVVEGSVTGFTSRESQVQDYDDVGYQAPSQKAAPDKDSNNESTNDARPHISPPEVEVVLDIEHHDWAFVTQPGAFRRVVMNLVGNSLKYTKTGFIKIKLQVVVDSMQAEEADQTNHDDRTCDVVLTVADSGIGISAEYLRTKVFTPFAQENSLAPGTGLGLSLVRSIVSMLGGVISIQSVLGEGTKVTVRFPMQRRSSSTTPRESNKVSAHKRRVEALRECSSSSLVSLFNAGAPCDSPQQKEGLEAIRSCIATYATSWYGCQFVAPLGDSADQPRPDVMVVDEVDLSALVRADPEALRTASVVVLCANASRASVLAAVSGYRNAHLISKPFGPYKLAKAFQLALNRSAAKRTQTTDPTNPSIPLLAPSLMHDAVIGAPRSITHKSQDCGIASTSILNNGGVAAPDSSQNTHVLNDKTKSAGREERKRRNPQYPFPDVAAAQRKEKLPLRPALELSNSTTPTLQETQTASEHVPALTLSRGILASGSQKQFTDAAPEACSQPRILLVDDNKINLKLLHTFMRKRAYSDVHHAEDGAQAVDLYIKLADAGKPPEIVFMDISMPIMDGFEATRRIREYEDKKRDTMTVMQTPAPALIIALTGNASARDQNEAFTSGVDVYLTKPVSFKEVGRLLDDWHSSGGAEIVNGA
ncbi:hypothetical protein LTR66_003724 [Elasticomyces elasticus]|nr:hypothetical protein LTR66_003724 [Elasticomyces elasticus]